MCQQADCMNSFVGNVRWDSHHPTAAIEELSLQSMLSIHVSSLNIHQREREVGTGQRVACFTYFISFLQCCRLSPGDAYSLLFVKTKIWYSIEEWLLNLFSSAVMKKSFL